MGSSSQMTLYRGCTPVVDAQFEATAGENASMTIINALATAMGVETTELPPLFEILDPDAVDHLFSNGDGTTESAAILSFNYRKWNIFVNADGRIRVCDASKPTDPQPVFEADAD